MNIRMLLTLLATCLVGGLRAQTTTTFCNPLNLEYRFTTTADYNYREAADPVIIVYQDSYYLFASRCEGYWWTDDFIDWTFVTPSDDTVDWELYAPSVWIYNDTLYYTSSQSGHIYYTADPQSGQWTKLCDNPHAWNDPWIFVDDDGRVYAYWGSAAKGDISCCELDPTNNYAPLCDDIVCIQSNSDENGYEVYGANNDSESNDNWTEGAALYKRNGIYYLTYATPGTELQSYCDGYYMSTSPTGPWTLGANSPVTFKTTGFVNGCGHGGLFSDKRGQVWTVDCVHVALGGWFDRRLAILPIYFDDDGLMYSGAALGDYPMYAPTKSVRNSDKWTGWNLLSYGKSVTYSSISAWWLEGCATDESLSTYWVVADSVDAAEQWLQVDLQGACTVNAVQVNFADVDAAHSTGRSGVEPLQYIVEYSTDNTHFSTLIDRTDNTADHSHEYVELSPAVTARYLRVTNKGSVPGGGRFAISGLRVFGNALGTAPEAVASVSVTRWESDDRVASVSWDASDGAEGYVLRFGIAPDKLWNHYMVWGTTSYEVRSLVKGTDYYYRVDAVNGSGLTEGTYIYDDEGTPTAILPIRGETAQTSGEGDPVAVYDMAGIRTTAAAMQAGRIYVMEYGDGNTKKLLR